MSDKFLNTGGGAVSLSNGTTTIFGATIGAINLDASQPLKTNSVKQIVSEKLDIADINSLQSELNIKDELTFIEDDTHTTPALGRVKLYAKTDGNFYKKDDQGNESGFGGGGGVSTSNAPVVDNSLVVYDGTTGNTIKYVPGLKYDATNNTLEVNDLETSNHFSLNDELQKISNITSATQGTPNITVFDGEIDVKVVKSASHNVELEFDNNNATLIADNDIALVTATGNIQINGNSISFLGPNIDYNGDDIEFWKKTGGSAANENFSVGDLAGNSFLAASSNNIAIGNSSLQNASSINDNIGIGAISLYNLTTGTYNTCIGNNAGFSLTTGTDNTFIGSFCADGNIDDVKNTAIGKNCLTNGGTNRTCIGANAITDADNQVSLGSNTVSQIINSGDNICDLGSTTHKFKDLYLGGTILGMPYDFSFACSNEISTITTTGEKMRVRAPRRFTISKIKVSVNIANTSSLFGVTIKNNGASIQLITQGLNLATNTTNTTTFNEDDIITVEVNNVGNSDATGLKVYFIGKTS